MTPMGSSIGLKTVLAIKSANNKNTLPPIAVTKSSFEWLGPTNLLII